VDALRGASESSPTFSEVIMAIQAINSRNQLPGRVVEIIWGPVVSEVDVETPSGIVTSVVTTRSIKNLDLHVGDVVVAVFKATEVLIAKG
jgi:molybdopterin-binding protein